MPQTDGHTSTTLPGFQPQLTDLTTAFNQANGALTQANGVTMPAPGTSADNFLTANGTVGNTGGALTNTGVNSATTGLTNLTSFNPTTLSSTATAAKPAILKPAMSGI